MNLGSSLSSSRATAGVAQRLRGHLILAAASLRRNRARTCFTVLGTALSVALFLVAAGLYDGYRQALDRSIARLGYHVILTAKGCPYETATLILRGGNIPMYLDAALFDEIRRDPDVAAAGAFFMHGMVNGPDDRFTVFLGVDDESRSLRPGLEVQHGEWFSGPLADEAILGYNAAEVLRLNPGDTLEVTRYGRKLTVRGVLDRTGSQDDGAVFLPLGLAQQLFDRRNKITGIGVRLRDLAHLDRFADRAYDIPSVQVITLSRVRNTIINLLGTGRILVGASAAVAVLVAALAILTTGLMTVVERRRELGVLQALGASAGDLFGLMLLESSAIGAIGGVVGLLLAALLGPAAEGLVRTRIPYAPPGQLLVLEPPVVGVGILGAIAFGLVAGLYPAIRAMRLRPVEAMRGA